MLIPDIQYPINIKFLICHSFSDVIIFYPPYIFLSRKELLSLSLQKYVFLSESHKG